MVPFAGFSMPVQYEGISAEHEAVRKGVGVFDVSHMGEFILKGDRALDLVQYVTSNDASLLSDGKVQYSYLPNEQGGIVDDLLVYLIDEKTYILVVNAAYVAHDWAHISKYNDFCVDILAFSYLTSFLAVPCPLPSPFFQPLSFFFFFFAFFLLLFF